MFTLEDPAPFYNPVSLLKIEAALALCADMALIKLNRINKGGEIVVNSEHIVFIEIESRSTTVHLLGNLLFSVEEPMSEIVQMVEAIEAARITKGIYSSGLTGPPPKVQI
jgi:hypothetical protein